MIGSISNYSDMRKHLLFPLWLFLTCTFDLLLQETIGLEKLAAYLHVRFYVALFL